jgi:hypothetical protein
MSATGGWYRVGECPEGKPQQRNVFEQKLTQPGSEPAVDRLTDTWGGEGKETVDTQDSQQAALEGQFRR